VAIGDKGMFSHLIFFFFHMAVLDYLLFRHTIHPPSRTATTHQTYSSLLCSSSIQDGTMHQLISILHPGQPPCTRQLFVIVMIPLHSSPSDGHAHQTHYSSFILDSHHEPHKLNLLLILASLVLHPGRPLTPDTLFSFILTSLILHPHTRHIIHLTSPCPPSGRPSHVHH